MKKQDIQKAVTNILQAVSNLKTSSSEPVRYSAGDADVEVMLVDFEQVPMLRWVAEQRGIDPDILLREIIAKAVENSETTEGMVR